MSTNPPTADLSPDQRQLLANIARRQIRQSLRAAYDAATVLMDSAGDTADHDRAIAYVAEIGHLMAKADQQLKDR